MLSRLPERPPLGGFAASRLHFVGEAKMWPPPLGGFAASRLPHFVGEAKAGTDYEWISRTSPSSTTWSLPTSWPS